ncbi:hypothetical protein [Paenibacillus taichungensis]
MSEESYILNWYSADRDYVARYQDTVFRIHRDYKTHRKHGYEPMEYVVYKLQLRKEKNIDFRDLGYEFYMQDLHDYQEFGKRYSVGGKFWTEKDDIIEKAEAILLNNYFIEGEEEDEQPKRLPSDIQHLAGSVLLTHLREQGYIRDDPDPNFLGYIESTIIRALNFYRIYDFSDITDEAGKINEIRKLEFIQEYLMFTSYPDNYSVWKENWDKQKPKHDEKWLQQWYAAAEFTEEDEEIGDDETGPAIEHDIEDTGYYTKVDIDLFAPRLLDILSIMHDHDLTWGHKALRAYQLFYLDETSDLHLHAKENSRRIEKLLGDLSIHSYSLDHDCDCPRGQVIESDIDVLQPAVHFLLRSKKLSLHAKGILLYMLLHRYRYCSVTELGVQTSKDLYNSNRAGLHELRKHEYVQEPNQDIFYVYDNFYKAVRRGLGIPYLERPYKYQ